MFSSLSLRYRIALVIFVLEACMLASVLTVTFDQTQQTAIDFNTASQNASLDLLSNLSISALLTGEFSDYQLYIQDIQKQPSLVRIILADSTGNVMAGSHVTDVGQKLTEILKDKDAEWKTRTVNTPAGDLGTVAVKFSNDALEAAYEKTRNISIIITVTGMSIIAFVGLATGFALTRRLNIVTETARHFANGDYTARSNIAGKDEVALLSYGVNHMADVVSEKEKLLREQNEHIELILESTAEGIYGVNTDGICTFVNPACVRMLGYQKDRDLIGKSMHDLIHYSYADGTPYPKEQCKIRLSSEQGKPMRTDDEVYWRPDGSSFPVEYWSRPMYRDNHRVGTVVAFIDISERKKVEEQIRSLAYFDPLTKLPNRRLLMDRLGHAIISGNRTREYGALIILDLDNFKILNDTQGHDIGDRLLVEVAQRLTSIAREEDTVSRLGGDEYVIIAEHLGTDESSAINKAELIAEKIHGVLKEPYTISKSIQSHRSTCSIGVTLFKDQTLSVENLIKQADVALYQAKGAGRNAIRFFNPEMQAAIESRSAMEAAMHMGLHHGEFQLYYQPQVDIDGKLIGAEALLRWFPTSKPPISPDEFIPVAEDSGLIIPIGLWVMQTACNQLKKWSSDPHTRDLHISINVSAKQFHLPRFFDQLKECLIQSGINPNLLKLELTESVVLENTEEVIEQMLNIKSLGVSFSLDDFGTGFSSLSYLKRLPLDQVKIDQSFIRDIISDSNDATIVRAIIAMCNSLDVKVIAEGVENQLQLDFLKRSGCSLYQGFLFSEAIPAEEWDQLL